MRPLILKCPSCAGDLTVARLQCPDCSITIDGAFSLPALLKLNRAQLDFVEVFIKNRGVIREVERELGVSYPTVRARLDEVIAVLGFKVEPGPAPDDRDERAEDPVTRSRRTVLEELRAGKITPEDALHALGGKAKPRENPDREEPDNG